MGWLLDRRVRLPGVTTLGRVLAQVRDDATQRLWDAIYELLTASQRAVLERLLDVPEGARFSDLERHQRRVNKIRRMEETRGTSAGPGG